MKSAPLLTVELVPALAWGRNVRSIVAPDTWAWLRWRFGAARFPPKSCEGVFSYPRFRPKLQCSCCKAEEETLELHEEWRYHDKAKMQRLVGLRPTCSKCHLAKHIGRATRIGRLDEALAHLAAVNGWTLRQARGHSARAFARWERRSRTKWQLNVCYLERYIHATKIHMSWLDNFELRPVRRLSEK
jgi:hypothetical protein